MHRLSPSGELGSFFFQPLDFHFQSAYLLVEFFFVRRVLGRSFTSAVFEQPRRSLQELLLPGRDLAHMHLILGGQLLNVGLNAALLALLAWALLKSVGQAEARPAE